MKKIIKNILDIKNYVLYNPNTRKKKHERRCNVSKEKVIHFSADRELVNKFKAAAAAAGKTLKAYLIEAMTAKIATE